MAAAKSVVCRDVVSTKVDSTSHINCRGVQGDGCSGSEQALISGARQVDLRGFSELVQSSPETGLAGAPYPKLK